MRKNNPQDISFKANRVLLFILVAMILILIRVWHLSIIQYEQKFEESKKPQRKSVIEPAIRATIRDRYNLPLAINKISYQATILYSQLRDIPVIEWQRDVSGQRQKVYKRKKYIRELSERLAQELNLSAEKIEDLIYAKAFYYSLIPFVIKEDLSEQEYYRLKMMEKEWPGLHVRHLPKRFYPKGRVASDVIGYMGAINRQEYEKILQEMSLLEEFIKQRENGEEEDTIDGIQGIQEARRRLRELEAKAYTIHDYVGKHGIEGTFEEQLRGYYGKRNFYVDSKGNYLGDLPGSRPPLSGQRILLTLSAELQEYTEQLLTQNERLRIVRKSGLGAIKNTIIALKEPFIKGGAVVVMDPNSAEILALASYPRFNPNDFIQVGSFEEKKEKKNQIHRWLENETYLAQIWNQERPLERERYDNSKKIFYDEQIPLTWKTYLDFILPKESLLRQEFNKINSLTAAIDLQEHVHSLLKLFPEVNVYSIFNFLYKGDKHTPHHRQGKITDKQKNEIFFENYRDEINAIKKQLDPYFENLPLNYDKVLMTDLCRLVVSNEQFYPSLLEYVGKENLENYHLYTGCVVELLGLVKEKTKELYHQLDFAIWRQREEKRFLQSKRQEEKNAKMYAKPYIDYLDQEEEKSFNQFWAAHGWDFLYCFLTGKKDDIETKSELTEHLENYFNHYLKSFFDLQAEGHSKLKWKKKYDILQKAIISLPRSIAIDYLKTMRSYDALKRPLLGSYRYLRHGTIQTEKQLACAFYPAYGFGYGRSYAYRQSSTQGSLFKLVTTYEVLVQRFQKMGKRVISPQDLNPLIIIDQVFQQGNTNYVGYTEDGKPIPQLYKGGRLPRSLAHRNNGRIDLLKAIEVSSNPYFALLAGECLNEPDDLSAAARLFSYGSRTGICLPGEIKGYVPQDLATNRTGLYAMAIGQHSLVVTPLQAAIMLATIVNGGNVLKPKLVKLMVGGLSPRGNEQIVCLPTFPHQESLNLVGIDFPLFSLGLQKDKKNLVKVVPTEIQREIFMPEVIRQILLKGLKVSTHRTHQDNMTSLTRLYRQYPDAIRDFSELKEDLLGKTSTSECVENIDLDLEEGTSIYTHVWFGSVVFEKQKADRNKAILLLKDEFGHPEIVVIVYLRYGGYGKEAAPLAAQIAKKWREIKSKNSLLHKNT